jgi:hypothetical protein
LVQKSSIVLRLLLLLGIWAWVIRSHHSIGVWLLLLGARVIRRSENRSLKPNNMQMIPDHATILLLRMWLGMLLGIEEVVYALLFLLLLSLLLLILQAHQLIDWMLILVVLRVCTVRSKDLLSFWTKTNSPHNSTGIWVLQRILLLAKRSLLTLTLIGIQ